jgi:hypothetical protein
MSKVIKIEHTEFGDEDVNTFLLKICRKHKQPGNNPDSMLNVQIFLLNSK